MMKKSLKFIFILILVALITACSNDTKGKDGEEITIEFMHSSVEQERLSVIDQLVDQFQKENPTIKVKQVPVEEDSYNTKIVTLASAGELPAVIEVGQDYGKVMNKDELIDIDIVKDIIESIGTETYYDGALNILGTEDGDGFIGVPMSGWVQGIWYNKEMFESKGFEEPQNWDEIIEIAKAFTDPSNKQYGIALPTVEGNFAEQSFSQFALSNNANVLDNKGNLNINTPEMAEALDFYKELSRYTMPGSNDTTEVKDAFMNGSAPMAVYSTYILPSVYEEGNAENIGFVIPTEKSKAVYASISSLTVSSGLEDSQKEASKKFITFMSKPENMTDWVLMSPGGAQPVSSLVLENPDYQANEVVSAFGDLASEIASSFEEAQAFGLVDGKSYIKMGNITSSMAIPKMINAVTVGEKSVESELENTEKAIMDILK